MAERRKIPTQRQSSRRKPLLHTGTGRRHSLLELSVFFNRTKNERELSQLTEDHLHIDCFSVMKIVQQQLLLKEVSAITEAINLFLNLRAEMTPIESIYLTFKDSILMSCGAKQSDILLILSPDTIAKPLIVEK